MTTAVPSSRGDVDAWTRSFAEESARRAGIPVREWLEQFVAQQATPEQPPAEPAAPTFAATAFDEPEQKPDWSSDWEEAPAASDTGSVAQLTAADNAICDEPEAEIQSEPVAGEDHFQMSRPAVAEAPLEDVVAAETEDDWATVAAEVESEIADEPRFVAASTPEAEEVAAMAPAPNRFIADDDDDWEPADEFVGATAPVTSEIVAAGFEHRDAGDWVGRPQMACAIGAAPATDEDDFDDLFESDDAPAPSPALGVIRVQAMPSASAPAFGAAPPELAEPPTGEAEEDGFATWSYASVEPEEARKLERAFEPIEAPAEEAPAGAVHATPYADFGRAFAEAEASAHAPVQLAAEDEAGQDVEQPAMAAQEASAEDAAPDLGGIEEVLRQMREMKAAESGSVVAAASHADERWAASDEATAASELDDSPVGHAVDRAIARMEAALGRQITDLSDEIARQFGGLSARIGRLEERLFAESPEVEFEPMARGPAAYEAELKRLEGLDAYPSLSVRPAAEEPTAFGSTVEAPSYDEPAAEPTLAEEIAAHASSAGLHGLASGETAAIDWPTAAIANEPFEPHPAPADVVLPPLASDDGEELTFEPIPSPAPAHSKGSLFQWFGRKSAKKAA